jgi:rhomboid protease GluP
LALLVAPSVGDEGTLVRAGALYRPAIEGGEWWRLYTSTFLHGGLLHLAVNMYGLYLLGTFTEDVLGSARFLAVYLVAGLGGAAASTWLGRAALSVGASGAILGLLGALVAALVLDRPRLPPAARRALLVNLVMLGAIQLYIGFVVPMIDNAAHAGGLAAGAAASFALTPGGLLGAGRRGTLVARVLATLLALVALSALFLGVRTPIAVTLARLPTVEATVDGARLEVPSAWQLDRAHATFFDPYLRLTVAITKEGDAPRLRASGDDPARPPGSDPRYRGLLERVAASARAIGGIVTP